MEAPAETTEAINLDDFEALARRRLPAMAYDYYASGAHDELTLRENVAAYGRIALRYRVLVDVTHRTMATALFGQPLSMPILIAPTAFHGLAHPEGEKATARAAGAAGTVMVLSSLSNTDVEDVIAASSGPVWFQLYVYRDRGATLALMERAEAAGSKAIVVTVDAPLLGRRERDVRNGFKLPAHLSVKNLTASGMHALPETKGDSSLAAYFASLLDQGLTYKDIEWLRSRTRLPVLVKGIVRADDATRAVDAGAHGIVVSNHGGRQLDTAPATVRVLEEIATAVRGRAEVLLDGGVRRGTDVIKALALGAKAVMLGRPILWALAADGERGVGRALEIIRGELDLAMALCGCPTLEAVSRDLIV
jgi:4-hydroxymandelate oxidase